VFVSQSVALAVPMAVAEHRLLEYLHVGDLDAIASAAYREGATILARAGVAGLSKTVQIQSIPAYQRGATMVVPLRWVATGVLGGAFPVLDANLELTATEDGTDLLVVGAYRPPFGVLGAVVDRLVMHSVAQATMRSFVSRIAEVAVGSWAAAEDSTPREPVPNAEGDLGT
jgi:hypothetical protein